MLWVHAAGETMPGTHRLAHAAGLLSSLIIGALLGRFWARRGVRG